MSSTRLVNLPSCTQSLVVSIRQYLFQLFITHNTNIFISYANRFVDPSWGFAMGWNYVMQWAFVLPLELTVCGTVIQYWAPDTSVAIWVSVSERRPY